MSSVCEFAQLSADQPTSKKLQDRNHYTYSCIAILQLPSCTVQLKCQVMLTTTPEKVY